MNYPVAPGGQGNALIEECVVRVSMIERVNGIGFGRLKRNALRNFRFAVVAGG